MPKKISRTKPVLCPVTGREHPAHIDQRAARSMAAIKAAFLRLITERGYDAVDVQSVCEAAGVSRATFYAHFAGKDDLKRKGIDQMRRELIKSIGAAEQRPFAFSESLFEHAQRHVSLYHSLLGGRGAEVAHAALREALSDLVRRDLAVRLRKEVPDIATDYYTGALFGVLTSWMASGARRPASEVDAEFKRLTGSS